eukprot:Pgem_evm1s535
MSFRRKRNKIEDNTKSKENKSMSELTDSTSIGTASEMSESLSEFETDSINLTCFIEIYNVLRENNVIVNIYGLDISNRQVDLHLLSNFTNMRVLKLSKCELTDEMMVLLSEVMQLHGLTDLNISGNNGITFEGIQNLALDKNNTLVNLSMMGTEIGLRGISILFQKLQKNNTLKYLNCRNVVPREFKEKKDPESTNQLISCLTKNKTITKLNIASNSLGKNDDCYEILLALAQNQTINTLNLRCNRLEKQSKAIADLLRTNSHIFSLDLYSTDVDESGLNEILDALETNTLLTSLIWGYTLTN